MKYINSLIKQLCYCTPFFILVFLFNKANKNHQKKDEEKINLSKIVDGECMMCGDKADTKDGWICSDCRYL